ncbi:metal ABC transporter ATP-binding protein [uncultured Psychrobacter sp.]|jgi:zinc transport system ATP-binding protein|uniref:metal ABC transporter ATP-binding protein n=1 Tax=uncultured Psychrobacter sp. TaxID=259303 RepID=UPI00262AC32D|nr:metal ABC transporter ATP-binding protein [uncultured Psychrobacter sp.]
MSATPLPTKQNSSAELLSLNNVSYDIDRQRLLSHISIDIAVNETVSLIGPNGAGKSTLVKLILGLITASEGTIKAHQPLQLGYVPQRFAVPPILPLRVKDLLAQADKRRLQPEQRQFIFDKLSLNHLLSRQMGHLSGGETQRVLLARALLDKPNLLILDEPMQGLDPDTEVWLYQFIDELPEFLRCAMLVVSHDLHWVMKGSRRVICLNKHICCEGQPSELAITSEFQKLFGHHYEQPYVHQHHACEHHAPSDVAP